MSATFLVDLNTSAQITTAAFGTLTGGTLTNTGAYVDCQPLDGTIHLLVNLGTVSGDGATITVTANECDNAAGTGATAIAGISQSFPVVAGANDSLAELAVQIYTRAHRYVAPIVTVTGGITPSVQFCSSVVGRKKITGTGNGAQL